MQPPPDAAGAWWASFAFPLCVDPEQPAELISAELDDEAAAQNVEYAVLDYPRARGRTVDRGGFLFGRPTTVQHDNQSFIEWAATSVPGEVSQLPGARVTAECTAPERAPATYVVVSLLIGPQGASADGLRIRYHQGRETHWTDPVDWTMTGCGSAVRCPS